jgi:LPXTG-motif cell wall-anchored protein
VTEPPTTVAPSPEPEQLPATGSDYSGLIAFGLLLVVLGVFSVRKGK